MSTSTKRYSYFSSTATILELGEELSFLAEGSGREFLRVMDISNRWMLAEHSAQAILRSIQQRYSYWYPV